MVIIKKPFIVAIIIFTSSLLLLTGCPGIGDRVLPSEEAKVSTQGDNICFWIPDVEGKHPVHIAINPRGTPFQQQNVIFDPDLKLINEKLCIPPSFFHFPHNGQFIIEYVLNSNNNDGTPRIVVTGIEISDGHVYSIPLTKQEVSR